MNKFIGFVLLAVVVLIFILPLVSSFLKFAVVVLFLGALVYFYKQYNKEGGGK
ncbi:hypothetical protein D3C81_2250560 [compost metagenome]|jgi:predicted membrane protein